MLHITNIPADAEAIILEFSDQDFTKMNNGGHGRIGMKVEAGTSEMIFPSVPGNTFELPDDVFLVKAHRAQSGDNAGAYLPPCSGGRGNRYYVTVKAVKIKNFEKKKFKKIDKTRLSLGSY